MRSISVKTMNCWPTSTGRIQRHLHTGQLSTNLRWHDIPYNQEGSTILCGVSTGHPHPVILVALRRLIFEIVHGLTYPSVCSTEQVDGEVHLAWNQQKCLTLIKGMHPLLGQQGSKALNPELANSTNPPTNLVTSMSTLSVLSLLWRGQGNSSPPSKGQQDGLRQFPWQRHHHHPAQKLSSWGGSADSAFQITSPSTET